MIGLKIANILISHLHIPSHNPIPLSNTNCNGCLFFLRLTTLPLHITVLRIF